MLNAQNTIALIPLVQSNARREGMEMSPADCLRAFIETNCRIRQHYSRRWLAKIERQKAKNNP